jgi:hypothetical protein
MFFFLSIFDTRLAPREILRKSSRMVCGEKFMALSLTSLVVSSFSSPFSFVMRTSALLFD